MDNLVLIKELLGIDIGDASKDGMINHFLGRARNIALEYCNTSELSQQYDAVILDFAVYLYKNRDAAGIIKKVEGERSIMFEVGIPENIRLALPPPKIKVGGY